MDFVLAGIAHQAACVFVAAAGRAQVSAAASAAGNGLGAWDDPLLGLDAHAQVVRERAQGGVAGTGTSDVAVFTFQIWPRMTGMHREASGAAAGNTSAKVGGKGHTIWCTNAEKKMCCIEMAICHMYI